MVQCPHGHSGQLRELLNLVHVSIISPNATSGSSGFFWKKSWHPSEYPCCVFIMSLSAILLITNLAAAEFIYTEAPFPSAHASNIVELRNGDLIASWFGGSAEGKPDVAIWTSRHTAAGWSAPTELAREQNIATYNPVMFHTRDGRLWFYYKFGPHPSSWSAARRYSDDEGATWSPIEHLPAGIYGPIRAKPLVMADGTVVSGTSVESYGAWACWIERSTDNGKTWTRIGPIEAPLNGIIQPSVISLGGNRL